MPFKSVVDFLVGASGIAISHDRESRCLPPSAAHAMLKQPPDPFKAPGNLLAIDGHCGLIAAWCALRYFGKKTSADRLVRTCGHTKRHGVFAIALACSLDAHGLDVAFHSDPDPSVAGFERRFFRKALRRGIPMLPAVTVSSLLRLAGEGQLPILLYEAPGGDGHFSHLLGEGRDGLILPLSEAGNIPRKHFAKAWSATGIYRQCVVVKGLKGNAKSMHIRPSRSGSGRA